MSRNEIDPAFDVLAEQADQFMKRLQPLAEKNETVLSEVAELKERCHQLEGKKEQLLAAVKSVEKELIKKRKEQ